MSTAALSRTDVEQLEAEAVAFAERHMAVWPDVDAFVDNFAEDTTFADPTWSDFRSGNDNLAAMLRQWAAFTDYEIQVTGVYVSADGAAFEETWPGLQPPVPPPPEPPVTHGLEVYRFQDGEIVGNDMWYPPDDNEVFGFGCFAVDGCPQLQQTVDSYIAAWSSRDPDAVAALYSDDAVFTDSMVGLGAQGADAIGDLADTRFGSVENPTIEVLGLYAWTEGRYPPSEAKPQQGRLIGIAIHYRADVNDDGRTVIQEGITTLELGARYETHMEADPRGLIHREDIFHEPASLLAALQP